jgi:hypothetical protein
MYTLNRLKQTTKRYQVLEIKAQDRACLYTWRAPVFSMCFRSEDMFEPTPKLQSKNCVRTYPWLASVTGKERGNRTYGAKR